MLYLAEDGAAELAQLPFAPGEGPFRVKGVAYRGHMDYVRDHLPGGLSAMLAALPDPAVRAFFDQPFLASVRYDVRPLALAGVACGKLTGAGYLPFVALRTRLQADDDIRGVYKFLLKFVSADVIAARGPKVMTQYFDFGAATSRVAPDGTTVGTLSGLPRPLAPWFITCVQAYVDQVSRIAANT